MIESLDFETIRLISSKNFSGFQLLQKGKVFFLKVKDYSSFALVVFVLQFVRSVYGYKSDNNDLFNLVFFGVLLTVVIIQSTFIKATQNYIEIDNPNKILKIRSRNIIGRFTRKKIKTQFNNIEGFRCKPMRTVGRIFIQIDNKEYMFLDIRNRKANDSNSLDSKTDAEFVVTCLENIFEIN